MTSNLAEALVEDFAEAGLAELVSPGKLKSYSGENVVEVLQEVVTGANGNEIEQIVIVSNGEVIETLNIEDEKFNDDFFRIMRTELNL